jgi:hypothetical protein
MEIAGPGPEAQAKKGGVVEVGRRQLDRLGTGGGSGLGWNKRLDLDRGRTEPRDPGQRTGGPNHGTRIEVHHEDTSAGGGRGRKVAHEKTM